MQYIPSQQRNYKPDMDMTLMGFTNGVWNLKNSN